METVVLMIDQPPRATRSQKTFGEVIARLLTFWIPRASPDYEKNLENVKYWYVEVDKSTGAPQREIGFDVTKRAILFAPTDKNYGLWTDSSATFVWTDHATVDKEVFNDIFEALEKHDFRIIEAKITKYLRLWTENTNIKIPELPILICNLDSMTDFFCCRTNEQLFNVDVTGYEWERQTLIDKTGTLYTTEYINFGHPVGCVVPKKIEKVLDLSEFKRKVKDRFGKNESEIDNSRTFGQLFELLERIGQTSLPVLE